MTTSRASARIPGASDTPKCGEPGGNRTPNPQIKSRLSRIESPRFLNVRAAFCGIGDRPDASRCVPGASEIARQLVAHGAVQ